MGLLFMIVVGSIFGLLATFVQQGLQMRGLGTNVLAGIAGALATGLVACPRLGYGTLLSEPYLAQSMLMVSAGALAATIVVRMMPGRRAR